MNETEHIQHPARRRLAKGALAGTAVLASITSKNALGASYACTVSGQQSGNLSRAGEVVNCQDETTSLRELKDQYDKGNKKKTEAPQQLGVKYVDPSAKKKKPSDPAPLPIWATIYQVLSGVQGLQFERGGDLSLAQATMVVYLNAARSDYHVSQQRCMELYEGALGSGMPLKDKPGVVWDADRCAKFLKLLSGVA